MRCAGRFGTTARGFPQATTTTAAPPKMSATQQPKVHRFSVEQYYELGELGLLDKRTELLEGIITDMEPIGPYHAGILQELGQLFIEAAQNRYAVRIQLPVDLGRLSQPQPDLVLCTPGRWRDRHPKASDISLLVEIALSSITFDLGEKLALYKAAEIREYWVVDLKAKQIHCFDAPQYRRQPLSEEISPEAWPDIRIDLRELFA
jgi:Uma2 family endonuclease